MSKKGGYKIVNLRDISLSNTAVTISGIYEEIENSHRKVILLSGIVIDNVEKNDTFIDCTVNEGNYIIQVYGGIITITSDDKVTYTTL